jgi:hypothetical protein
MKVARESGFKLPGFYENFMLIYIFNELKKKKTSRIR